MSGSSSGPSRCWASPPKSPHAAIRRCPPGSGSGAHNGGWLRFDGSRLAEERGACLVELGKPTEAEKALTVALRQGLSDRRRVGVLVDLAKVGAQLHDSERLAMYTSAALDITQRSQSGVNEQRLNSLTPYLDRVPETAEVKTLRSRINELRRKGSA